MARVEAEIAAHGFAAAELTATPVGVPLYAALGWRVGCPVAVQLAPDLRFIGLVMTKTLAPSHRRAV
jgi:hypothetical protein